MNMTLDDLASSSGEWLRGSGPESDIVISSRIRLARNLADFPFISRATEADRAEIEKILHNQVAALKGNWTDLNETIGKTLMGPATRIVDVLRAWVTGAERLIKTSNILQVTLAALAVVAAAFALVWIVANLPIILLGAAIAGLILIIEDLYTGLEGGNSVIKDWFIATQGEEAWNRILRTWEKGKRALDAIMSGEFGKAWDIVTSPLDEADRADLAAREQRRQGKGPMTAGERNLRENPWTAQWWPDLQAWAGKTFTWDRAASEARSAAPVASSLGLPLPRMPAAPSGPPSINITVQGNADQDTTREMERIARRVLEDDKRDLLYTVGTRAR